MASEPACAEFDFADWGRLSYGPALDRQREWNEAIQCDERPETLVVVEHDPVITISRRPEAKTHLVANDARIAALGIEVVETDRGGDITYHGPGQLVAYPMVRIKPMGLGVAEYMRFLESVVIEVLAAFQIRGTRVKGNTGVWVEQGEGVSANVCAKRYAKICAMGVRVRRGVTMHGLALNVAPDMSHFETIVPCGLPDPVTSMAALQKTSVPSMMDVQRALFDVFQRQRMESRARFQAAKA